MENVESSMSHENKLRSEQICNRSPKPHVLETHGNFYIDSFLFRRVPLFLPVDFFDVGLSSFPFRGLPLRLFLPIDFFEVGFSSFPFRGLPLRLRIDFLGSGFVGGATLNCILLMTPCAGLTEDSMSGTYLGMVKHQQYYDALNLQPECLPMPPQKLPPIPPETSPFTSRSSPS